MHLVNLTTAGLKRIVGLSFALFIYSITIAQENSPYSRYGLGDIVPNQNIVSRGMGGVGIAASNIFSINFTNPASLGNLTSTTRFPNTIFDLGGEIDIRTLKSTNNASKSSKYTSTNTLISYLQVAFPIAPAKMERKNIHWALSFGLRPVTRINYKIEKNERLTGIDSLNTMYEGSGGVNQFNLSTGLRFLTSHKKGLPESLSIGLSSGYTFGNKDYSTRLTFINDTVAYLKSNTQTQSHFGGVFLNIGVQYQLPLGKNRNRMLNIGAYANLQQNLKAKQDHIDETVAYGGSGDIVPIDTVASSTNLSGTVKMPSVYGIGFNYQDSGSNWTVGADFEYTDWKSYSYFGEKDNVQNSWILRVGAEYYPAKKNTPSNKYFKYVKYRAGFYLGPDYVKLDKTRTNYAATVGASFPLTIARLLQMGEYVSLNTAVEYGGRGNRQSFSFHENTLRFCIGLSMNARWFVKKSYF
ncbi:MAG: hypothetical protein QM737_10435 [Ferruginibacter sp.]